jgi:hypothetical protein
MIKKISFSVFFIKKIKWLRPWISEFVIRGIIPERAGKYRILDMLLILEEKRRGNYDRMA